MEALTDQALPNWIAQLHRFAAAPPRPRETCELCGNEIAEQHPHLIEPAMRRLLCACRPCALLFEEGASGRFRRVPERARRLEDFALDEVQWEAFAIPTGLAFFFRSSLDGKVRALYPGPAGATESALDLSAWHELEDANPPLRHLRADVEALLVNRMDHADETWIVPIDRCYALAGEIRRNWHGITGGEAAREAVRMFFAQLDGARGHAHA